MTENSFRLIVIIIVAVTMFLMLLAFLRQTPSEEYVCTAGHLRIDAEGGEHYDCDRFTLVR
jgi:hypothetical protein